MDIKPIPLQLVVEGLLLILQAASLLAAIFLVYAGYLFQRRPILKKRPQNLLIPIGAGAIFIAAILAVPYGAYKISLGNNIAEATTALAAGIAVCATFYFLVARKQWPDDRVQYTVLMLSIFAILIFLLLIFISWVYGHGGAVEAKFVDPGGLSQYINTLAQVVSILIAATMVVITNRQNARQANDTARQHIYQTLEIESVKLFRFEIAHPELVEQLWYGKAPKRRSSISKGAEEYVLKEYICQILNLFEMACRFRKQGIIEFDIFGSWVIWMWELCGAEIFQQKWEGKENNTKVDPGKEAIEFNYIEEFRELINAGIYFSRTEPPAEMSARNSEAKAKTQQASFFSYISENMTREDDGPFAKSDLMEWLNKNPTNDIKFYRYWTKPKPAATPT